MALLIFSLSIALMFLPVVESEASTGVVGGARDRNTENTYLQQNDDMTNVLAIVKSQGLIVSKLETKIEKHEKLLSDQGDTINKLKQIVEEQSEKLSKLEVGGKVKEIKMKKIKNKLKILQRKCAFESFLEKAFTKNRLDEAANKPASVDKRQLPVESIEGSGIQITRRSASHISFSAYLSHFTENLGTFQIIRFDQVLVNDGNAYNGHTGVFTVPVSGTYVFMFYVSSSNTDVTFFLVTDSHIQASAVARPTNFNQVKDVQGGATVILSLNQGVSVWIKNWMSGSSVFSTDIYRWVTFSGFLLY